MTIPFFMEEEYNSMIADLWQTEEVQKMATCFQHVSAVTCLDHCLMVSYFSYCFCRFFGWKAKEAARAGLLHDCYLYDWRRRDSHQGHHAFLHPQIACANAERISPLTELEKDIILKHMWPLTLTFPKYKESYVVTLADKICATIELLHLYPLLAINRKKKGIAIPSSWKKTLS